MTTAVTVSAPLPASFAPHPAACDKLTFLRIRRIGGPADPSNADKILIAQPGVLEGASSFYNVGANVVSRAYTERGKYIEFWAVDRRPNCLEDLNGLKLAKSTGNPLDLINYYYKKKPYNGATFAGFLGSKTDAEWLTDMGIGQTVRDWNQIITRGIPSQSVRQQKVYCGGHSLGGFITGQYAEWDFDGNTATKSDAGYNQCAGFFGLDTTVTSEARLNGILGTAAGPLTPLMGEIPAGVTEMMRAGTFPRFVDVHGVINPEIMNLLAGVGVGASMKPTSESDLIKNLPANSNVNSAYKFYFSQNLGDYLSQFTGPAIKLFRFTNQALLGTFTDDNAMPLSIVQASTGFYKGGSVVDKDFPIPGALTELPDLKQVTSILGSPNLAIPDDAGPFGLGGPLYGWNNFNQLGGVTIPNNSDGTPYTGVAKEVTDINDLARSMAAVPADFVEKYFPIHLVLDSLTGTPGNVHTEGDTAKPIINIMAGDGPGIGGTPAPGTPSVPGYNHVDVLTAAPIQNNGLADPVTTHLLDFLY
ncbi:MAG: hypothetical protein HZB14_04690 [Actinobacteria bacterium]|nr:hypothetical protein [Actinomycetota bacterium]